MAGGAGMALVSAPKDILLEATQHDRPIPETAVAIGAALTDSRTYHKAIGIFMFVMYIAFQLTDNTGVSRVTFVIGVNNTSSILHDSFSLIFPAVPKKVHIVLSESGVTKIKQVPVGNSSFFFE